MFYLYIIQSIKNGSFYIGQTKNIKDRILRHNKAKSLATKSGCPWKLVYVESYDTRSDVVKKELQLKKQKSHRYIERFINRGVAQLG